MQRTELFADVSGGGPYTLIAPVDEAFDFLPWSFDRLMADEQLIESCVDVFEYLVVRGVVPTDGPSRAWMTLQGESVRIGGGFVNGSGAGARIVTSLRLHGLLVHAVDVCVTPSSVRAKLRRSSF